MGKITGRVPIIHGVILFLLMILSARGVHAQSETPIITPSPTPTTEPVLINLTLFRDADSITLYIPASVNQVNLRGLAFQVTTAAGTQITRYLESDFSAFLGMPFDNLLTPACFRLVRSGYRGPVPQVCQGNILLLTQEVVNADVFWYDAVIGQDRLILILRDSVPFSVCASGQSLCSIGFALPTPTPTFTPSPTEKATPTPAASLTAAVTATPTLDSTPIFQTSGSCTLITLTNTNVRSGPGTSYGVIGQLSSGEQMAVTGRNSSSPIWYSINFDNLIGWINSTVVSIKGDCASFDALTPSSHNNESCTGAPTVKINVRAGAGREFEIIRQLDAGTQVVITGQVAVTGSLWYSIYDNGLTGWLDGRFVALGSGCAPLDSPTQTPEVTGACTLTAINTNIRSGPAVSFNVVGTLTRGERAVVTGQDSGWYEIRHNGYTGWINGQFVTLEGDCS